LGDTVQITMGQSPDGSTYSDVPSDYILVQGNADLQNGWVSPRVWTSQMTKKADAGDLIMSVRAPAGAMGKTAYNAVIGRGVAAIKGNEFIYQLLEKMDSDGYWKALSCGSTFESLNSDNIKNADVLIPDVAEQEKIGEYFLAIDRLITLHQRKYDKLTKVKKAMLEKMFPENGSPYPEIRFKGFTDAWEQRKLGEISESFEYGLNAAATEYDGKHKYIRITDIDDSTHLFLQDDLTSPDIDFSTADDYLLQEGDVLFARTGASVGKTYIYRRSDGDLYFAGFLIRAKIKSDYDADFVFQNTLTDSYDSYIRITSQRSGQPGVNAQEYANFALSVPSLAEQKKIGAYFSHLDSLITLHQRKLEKLKNIKKACLEKMFV
jgi:type I restriction enzyme S subunit